MPKKRFLPADSHVRQVDVLFPQADRELAETERATYRALLGTAQADGKRGYALAIDRQSDPKEYRRRGHTGGIRRVEFILHEAESANLYLPEPSLIEGRTEDRPPYDFSRVATSWFVDGIERKATGYAASPYARPRLWDAFLLAQALAAEGIGPAAYIIGEPTRFFRNEQWLGTFVRALWKRDIQFIVAGWGVVDEDMLAMLAQQVRAQSKWLPMSLAGARKIRRSRNQIAHNNKVFGLTITGRDRELGSPERCEVWTRIASDPNPDPRDPEGLPQWEILTEMIERLADGRNPTANDSVAWLSETHGVHRCRSWLTRLLTDKTSVRLREGVYVTADKHYQQRELEQKGGLLYDLDITESGNRRYRVTEKEDPLILPIRYTEGTVPIPVPLIESARERVEGKLGRPCREAGEAMGDSILPRSILRCAVCGCAVEERAPGCWGSKTWSLRCNCIDYLRGKHTLKTAAARAHPLAQHTLIAHAQLSNKVWAKLAAAVAELATSPAEPEAEWRSRHAEAELQFRRAGAEFTRFQRQVGEELFGDPANPDVAAFIKREREQKLAALKAAREEQQAVAALELGESQRQLQRAELAWALRLFQMVALSPAQKREVIERFVPQVRAHLSEGWFEMDLVLSGSAVETLTGCFDPDEEPILGGRDGRSPRAHRPVSIHPKNVTGSGSSRRRSRGCARR